MDRIAAGAGIAGQQPSLPGLGLRIVAADLAGLPEADPEHALGIRPHPARADALLRRLDDRDVAGRLVDPAEMVAGERHVPNLVRRRHRDAVAAPPRRLPAFVLAGPRIDIAVHAVLAGEPVDAVLVEHACV